MISFVSFPSDITEVSRHWVGRSFGTEQGILREHTAIVVFVALTEMRGQMKGLTRGSLA